MISATATRRGAGAALFLLFSAAWFLAAVAWAWAVWTAPPARAQQAASLDLGYAAENLLPPEALLGEWRAVIKRNGKPQPVTLAIKDVTPGKTAGKMTFASPRRCVIDLEYGGPDQGRHIFYMIRFTNCFDYGSTDFVALAQVPGEDIAALHGEEPKEKSKRSAEILKKFGLSQSQPEAAPGAAPEVAPEAAPEGIQEDAQEGTGTADNEPAAAPPKDKGLTRIVYAINLDGEVHDSAILTRQ